MDELTERDRAAYAAVDDALHTYPIQPAPDDLLPAVMACIQPAGRPPARWSGLPLRLTWLDYAISLFAAGMVSLVMFISMAISLPPDWAARLQFQLSVWWVQFSLASPAIGIVLLASLALGLLGLLLGVVLFNRERLGWL